MRFCVKTALSTITAGVIVCSFLIYMRADVNANTIARQDHEDRIRVIENGIMKMTGLLERYLEKEDR